MKTSLKKNDFRIIISVFLLDRFVKFLVIEKLKPIGQIKLLPFLDFTYVENTGAAFGIFQNGVLPLIIFSIILIVSLILLKKHFDDIGPLAGLGVVFVIGGAVGNLYDRMVIGNVIDFIDFKVWPVFNVADSFVCIGSIIICLAILRSKRKKGALS
jgi:signal peptidase II